ncbi:MULTISPECIES: gluconokinase [unclassified Streptomyces]|uniref:gluconokinase n=1 Tax=unclassified Streptomyces TaxID=2593676 RepID=UPI000B19C9ED
MRAASGVPVVIVVMGVSGAGKTTVGKLLAQRLGLPYLEADDLHPAANRAKMASGHALTDEDREPWLRALADWIRQVTDSGRGGVMACSALKREYRDLLRQAGAGVWFLHLELDPASAAERVDRRAGHFMPPGLEGSQYATLEPLRPDEPGMTVDATADPRSIVDEAARAVPGSGTNRSVPGLDRAVDTGGHENLRTECTNMPTVRRGELRTGTAHG